MIFLQSAHQSKLSEFNECMEKRDKKWKNEETYDEGKHVNKIRQINLKETIELKESCGQATDTQSCSEICSWNRLSIHNSGTS